MFPSTQEFLINVPLYRKCNLRSYSPDYILGLEYFSGTIDAYCLGCGQRSVFKNPVRPFYVPRQDDYREKYLDDRHFLVEMKCTRDEHHTMRFYFEVLDSEVFKVGQYPTLADLQEQEIVKYRKYLGRQYPEFTRAVGLFAHGIGIGSYVYLRRIIESLVQKAHVRAQKDTDWVEDNYQRSRVHERIAMLSCVKDLYTDFVLFVKSGFIFTEEHIINGLQSDKHRICFPKDNEADYAKLYNQKADKESYLNEKFYVFDMYYMHPDGLFLTTKLSLDCVSSKFLKTYKMDYSQYCFKRALELGIDITHKSKVDRGVLSKVFEKIEWMKYFCFNFADCRKSMFLDSSNMIISKHGFIRKVSILERFTHFIKYIAEAVSKGYSIAKKKTL